PTGQPRVHLDQAGNSAALRFEIERTVQPGLIDVRNLGTGDIVLRNGKLINNPIGETRLLASGGNIVAETGAAATYLIRTGAMGSATSTTVPADFEGEGNRRFEGLLAIATNGSAPDTLTRQDGGSWVGAGFQVGDLVKIEVAGRTPTVVQIAGFSGAGQQTAVLSTISAVTAGTVQAQVSRFHGIEATRGSVGSLAAPVRVEVINSPDQVSQLFGEAGVDLFLDVSARVRGVTPAADPNAPLPVPTPRIDLVTAGRDTVVRIGQTVIEAGDRAAGGLLVTTAGKPAMPDSGTYFNHYRPDVLVGGVPVKSFYPTAAFGSGTATAVDATWTFGLAEAGQHVRIGAIDSTAPTASTRVVNILGVSNVRAGGAFVDILTNGFIGSAANPWREIVAVDAADGDDLRIGSIRSTADDVVLLAPRAFVDADSADNDLTSVADVGGINITLTALAGGVGSAANFIETDLVDVVGGTVRNGSKTGALSVASRSSVYIEEIAGNLRVQSVVA
ncbi:MAG TPA: hypothetical protein VK570_13540, partial [Rubrivivax sp.]|nr:hypothetical protein [Rubrivivax sp.]